MLFRRIKSDIFSIKFVLTQVRRIINYLFKILEIEMYTQSNKNTLFVEFFRACDTHRWCTHHNEEKYLTYFNKCKNIIILVS